MRLERCRAVGANDPQIPGSVVVSNAICVIEDQAHLAPIPDLALAAQLAGPLLQALREEAPLEVMPRVRRTLDQDLRQRLSLSRIPGGGVWVEVIGRDSPCSRSFLERCRIAARRAVAETAQGLRPGARPRDRAASLVFRVSNASARGAPANGQVVQRDVPLGGPFAEGGGVLAVRREAQGTKSLGPRPTCPRPRSPASPVLPCNWASRASKSNVCSHVDRTYTGWIPGWGNRKPGSLWMIRRRFESSPRNAQGSSRRELAAKPLSPARPCRLRCRARRRGRSGWRCRAPASPSARGRASRGPRSR